MVKTLRMGPGPATAILGLAFGLLYMVLTPPFQANDEWNHFFRAYQVSEGGWLSEVDEASGLAGGRVPVSLLAMSIHVFNDLPYTDVHMSRAREIMRSGRADDDMMNPFLASPEERGRRAETILTLLDQPLEPERRAFMYFIRTAAYTPVAYAPQALGMAIGRHLGLGPVGIVYAGRMGNLIVWALLMGLAAGLAGGAMGWLFLALALMPASVFLGASLSVDALTNGLAFLSLSVTARAMGAVGRGLRGGWPLAVGLALLALLTGLTKYYVFLPLGLLVALAPGMGRGRALYVWALAVGGFLLAGLVTYLWTGFAEAYFVELDTGVSPRAQRAAILADPAGFALVLGRTAFRYGGLYAREYLGRLGHFSLMMPGWAMAAQALALAWVGSCALGDRAEPGPWRRGLLACVFAASLLPVALSTYLAWTPVGGDVVSGLQGRYLIPIGPALMMALAGRGQWGMRHMPGALALVQALILTAGAWTLYTGFFG